MSSNSPRLLSRINLPRLVLWVASVVIGLVGYYLIASSNAKQTAVYTSGKADYAKLFAAQSGATVGGLLIAVGVLGLLLALVTLALAPRPVAIVAVDETDDLDDEFDDDDATETPSGEATATTTDPAWPAPEKATDTETETAPR
jgi:hypothetical protein